MNTELPEPPSFWVVNWASLGFAYCGIYAIGQKTSGWPIKVGISTNAQSRLSSIQTGVWSKLQVFGYWLCEDSKAARTVEQATHALLRRDKLEMNGEWFDIRANQVGAVVEFVAAKAGIELVTKLPNSEKFREAKELAERARMRQMKQRGAEWWANTEANEKAY